jgi:hypothetical protein
MEHADTLRHIQDRVEAHRIQTGSRDSTSRRRRCRRKVTISDDKLGLPPWSPAERYQISTEVRHRIDLQNLLEDQQDDVALQVCAVSIGTPRNVDQIL